jgi:hypothetical protein
MTKFSNVQDQFKPQGLIPQPKRSPVKVLINVFLDEEKTSKSYPERPFVNF